MEAELDEAVPPAERFEGLELRGGRALVEHLAEHGHAAGATITGWCARAKLTRADLRGARLTRADLRDADLEEARLDHADLGHRHRR